MFIGREKELSQLEEAYNGEGCKFFVIQGGKGIGKTTLIEEFCRNKNAVIFSPVSMGAKANLKHFSWLILRHYSDTMQREFQFWEDALNYIAGKNERIIIAVDNADMLASSSPVIMKVFAKVLASSFEGKNILLIFSCKDSSQLKVQDYLTEHSLYSLKNS